MFCWCAGILLSSVALLSQLVLLEFGPARVRDCLRCLLLLHLTDVRNFNREGHTELVGVETPIIWRIVYRELMRSFVRTVHKYSSMDDVHVLRFRLALFSGSL